MSKIEISVEINDESLLGTLYEVKEAERNLSMQIAVLESKITGKYPNFKNYKYVGKY